MKKLLFSFLMVSFCFLGNSQVDKLTIETVPLTGMIGFTDFTGQTNYRIYAEATDPSDQILRVLGNVDCPLDVTSTTSFYRNAGLTASAPTGDNINPGFWGFGAVDTRYSSCVGIGIAVAGYLGIPEAEDMDGSANAAFGAVDGLQAGTGNATTLVSAPGEEWWLDFQSAAGSSFTINTFSGGSWFSTPGGANSLGLGVNNSVFLASLTTNGDLSYNMSVGIQSGTLGAVDYLSCDEDGIDNLIYPLTGCTDATACNYNAFADAGDIATECNYALGCDECAGTPDDGTGTVTDNPEVGEACDDMDATTENDEVQGDCSCAGTVIPATDACTDAVAIVVGAAPITGDNSGTTDENFGAEPACFGNDAAGDGDVWFSFDGTGGLVDIQTFENGMDDTQIAIYDDCAGAALACSEDISGANFMSFIEGFCAEAGTTYFIEVEGWGAAAGTFDISVVVSGATAPTICDDVTASNYEDNSCGIVDNSTCEYPPSNDTCLTAAALATDGTVVTGDNTGGTSQVDAAGSTAGAPDVWYSFIGTGNTVEIETNQNGGMTDSQMALFSDCAGTLIEFDDDDSTDGAMSLITGFCTTLGTEYYIEVQGWNGAVGSFDIFVTDNGVDSYCSDNTATNYVEFPTACQVEDNPTCLYVTPGCQDMGALNFSAAADADCAGVVGGTDTSCCVYPPANDLCTTAQALVLDDPAVSGDNTNSTSTFDAAGSTAGAGDVWFSFVGTGALVNIETTTNGGMTDSQMALTSDCAGTLIEFDDDDSTDGNMSLISDFCAEAGTTYYVEIQGWNGAVGTFDISLTSSGTVLADICDDPAATNYTVPTGCTTADNAICMYPPIANDVFVNAEPLAITAYGACTSASGTNDGATDSPESTNASEPDVWYSITCNEPGLRIEVLSGDMDIVVDLYDAAGTFIVREDATIAGAAEIMLTDAVVGQEYRISIHGWNGQVGNFDICAQELRDSEVYGPDQDRVFACSGYRVLSSDFSAPDGTFWTFDDGVNAVIEYNSASSGVNLDNTSLLPGTTYTVQVNPFYEGFEVTSLQTYSISIAEPASALKSQYVNATVALSSSAYVRCVQATACGSEGFQWRVTNVNTGVESIINNSNDFLLLSQITDVSYGQEYTAEVAVVYGGGTVSAYGAPQTFFTGDAPVIQLRSQFNSANTTLTPAQNIAATLNVYLATDYEWEVERTDVTEITFVYQRGLATRFARVEDMPLAEGGTYNLRARALVAGATTAFGPTQEVVVIGGAGMVLNDEDTTPVMLEATDVKDNVISAAVTMFPNPTTDFVTLNITGIEEGTDKVLVDIFNSVGQIVQSEQIAADGNYVNTVVTLDGLAEGMYNVQITVGNSVSTERMIVQK